MVTALAAPALAQTTVILAVQGDPAPGGQPGDTFDGLFHPSLNNAGQVAVTADLNGSFSVDGVYRLSAAGTTMIARDDEPVPGGAGVFDESGSNSINDLGQVAFRSLIVDNDGNFGNDQGLFRGDGTTTVQIVRAGQTAPGGPGVFRDLYYGAPAQNDLGQVTFLAQLGGSGVDATNDFAFYRGDGASLVQIVRLGQAAFTGPGTITQIRQNPNINAAGQSAFLTVLGGAGVTSANNRAIYRGDGVTTVQIVRQGAAAPVPSSTFDFLRTEAALNDAGQVAFIADISGAGIIDADDAGVFRGDGVSTTLLVREGQAVPGGPGVFVFNEFDESFQVSAPSLNRAGQVAFTSMIGGTGVTSDNNTGIYRADDLGVVAVAREGETVPDGPGVFRTFGNEFYENESPALNNRGQIAFAAELDGVGVTDANDFGIYLYDPDLGLITVIREGDALLGSTVRSVQLIAGSEPSVRSGLNDLGQVAYRFQLADYSDGIAIFSIPEPTSMAVLGLAGAAMLRRRQRA